METNNRRDFLKKAALAGASALVAPSLFAADGEGRRAVSYTHSEPTRTLPEDQGWRFGKQIDCSQK